MKVKPFTIEEAMQPDAEIVHNGKPVKFIAYVPEVKKEWQRLLLLIDGEVFFTHINSKNLSLVIPKRKVWVNLYPGNDAVHFQTEYTANLAHQGYAKESYGRERIGGKPFLIEIDEEEEDKEDTSNHD